jgi:hypothetical protein
MSELADRFERRFTAAGAKLDLTQGINVRGVVTRVADDVAWVAGLDHVGYDRHASCRLRHTSRRM